MSLQAILCCAAAIAAQAAFVPTAPSLTKHNSYCSQRLMAFKTGNALTNLQDALPDLNIDKLNPLSSSPTSNKIPSPPTPPPFDPTNPEALIAITKSFISTDFGIQTSQLPSYSTAPVSSKAKQVDDTVASSSLAQALPFYSSSLLSNDFIWVSANNLNDGRAGILNKGEYLAAGRFFNLRRSFPDLEYRAHDFRVLADESNMYDTGLNGRDAADAKEITVRFTTRVVGTFRGAPLRLRSKILEPNGKVMRCPPTSVSITFATRGDNAGKIIKLVNDMVIDRQFGNTNGLSGIAGAAVCAGAAPSDLEVFPPSVSAGRVFARPIKPLQERSEDDGYLPPFPDSVMIQLAKGVAASNFGLDDPDLLSVDFSYLEPLMGPMNKERYIEVFSEYNVRDAVPDLDYRFENYRIDPYDPYRVWVDTRARGTRTGPIGRSAAPASSKYLAPPESMSFTFDNDGFCTRITAAATLDPLLGNTGLLGGVYGLLYATGTPENPLKTRTINLLLNRAQKVALKSITKAGVDEYRLSDGRIINGNKSIGQLPPSSSISSSTIPLPSPPKLPPPSERKDATMKTPFFAVPKPTPTISLSTKVSDSSRSSARPKAATVALPKTSPVVTPPITTLEKPQSPGNLKAEPTSALKSTISENPQDPVTDAFSSFFGTSEVTSISSGTLPVSEAGSLAPVSGVSKTEELRKAAAAARKEAAEAREKAAAQKAKVTLSQSTPTSVGTKSSPGEPKQSPTFSIFGASPGLPLSAPSKKVPKTTSRASSPASTKSTTFSLFGTSPTSKGSGPKPQTPAKSSTPKPSPTLSLFGPASPSASTPVSAPPASMFRGQRAPTFSILGSSLNNKSAPSNTPKKSMPKGSAAKKTKTFNISGVGGGLTKQRSTKTIKSVSNKETAKGTTIPILQGTAKSNGSPSKKTASQPAATKATMSSLFQGANTSKSYPAKPQRLQTEKATSIGSKSSPPVSSFFGGLFGVSSSTNSVASKSSSGSSNPTTKKTNLVKTKPTNVGIPTLKQWKVNSDNSVEGRIFGSSSFKDGATVTTSPIGSKFKIAKGNVVQTSSGSKYLLS
eukprot:CCRYP_021221-RA/>CCRYP_021221-RA protein AED:0.08 eAED:0.08 QI:191/1/1/1/0.66/0.5/4/275/1069